MLVPSFDTETLRTVVLGVLIIASVQLVLARPRLKREKPEASTSPRSSRG